MDRITYAIQDKFSKDVTKIKNVFGDFKKILSEEFAGKAIRQGNNFTINGRTYGMHDGTLYPISGKGFVALDRGGYKALGVYKIAEEIK